MTVGQSDRDLPHCGISVTHYGVRTLIIRTVLILSVLFGALGTPLAAAVVPHSAQTMPQIVEIVCQSQERDDDGSQSPVNEPAGHHHHCMHGVPGSFPSLAAANALVGTHFFPADARLNTPTAQAPPTQPPSA